MILLSDEEIKGVKELANNPHIKEGMLILHIYDTERAIAKAQLKQVVEYIEKYVYHVDKRGYGGIKPNATANWQDLLKEIG